MNPDRVDGVNSVVWNLAREQLRIGHSVGLVVAEPIPELPSDLALDFISFDRVAQACLRPPGNDRPVVHFHSVFVPRHALLSFHLRRIGQVYVASPHGGLAPEVLGRGRLKKALYGTLVERRHFGGAAFMTAVLEQEVADISAFVSHRMTVHVVGNPISKDLFSFGQPRLSVDGPLVFLGRFDVQHKGLDDLYDIARHLPDRQFHLYGRGSGRDQSWRQLERHRPSNISVFPPVFGDRKTSVLQQAAGYIQTSRWEAFGLSVVEAMAMGIPIFISERMHLADSVRRMKMGTVLPTEIGLAAQVLSETLSSTDQLTAMSIRARQYALENFHPSAVVARMETAYRAALQRT